MWLPLVLTVRIRVFETKEKNIRTNANGLNCRRPSVRFAGTNNAQN